MFPKRLNWWTKSIYHEWLICMIAPFISFPCNFLLKKLSYLSGSFHGLNLAACIATVFNMFLIFPFNSQWGLDSWSDSGLYFFPPATLFIGDTVYFYQEVYNVWFSFWYLSSRFPSVFIWVIKWCHSNDVTLPLLIGVFIKNFINWTVDHIGKARHHFLE